MDQLGREKILTTTHKPFGEYSISRLTTSLTLGYTYEFEQISNALEKGLGGIKPAVKCDYDKELKASVLSQISVCLNKVSNFLYE